MFEELKNKKKLIKEKEVQNFFYEHIYDKSPQIIQQNLSELLEVKRKIESQISMINPYSIHPKSKNPFSALLSFHENSSLTEASFNHMVENYSTHKEKLNKIIEILAKSSIFKVVSPEGFPFLESGEDLNDVQKSDLLSSPFVILPIFKSDFSILCIDHNKEIFEYYSKSPFNFESNCQVLEKSFIQMNRSEPYDWSLMELPSSVTSSSQMLGVFYCLTQDIDLINLEEEDFISNLFKKLNKRL